MVEQDPLSNHQLGEKYVLGALLGQGGFGMVYQAQHVLLRRQQAIKIMLEQYFIHPEFRYRFLREAQTLAALDHPNIVHVDDFGIDGNLAYLVMPYISGGTLARLLKERRIFSIGEVIRFLEQMCAALDYAHARNVAHLDLKPQNLLLHEDERLLLSDFGLAHLMEQGAIKESISLHFGTPQYMAPEHIHGQPERRSDLYALGIIVYQMLTGRVPFDGANAAEIILKHLTERPPSLLHLRPDLPPDLNSKMARALAKQANQRYQSAGELLADFRAVAQPKPDPERQVISKPEPKTTAQGPVQPLLKTEPKPAPRQVRPGPEPQGEARPPAWLSQLEAQPQQKMPPPAHAQPEITSHHQPQVAQARPNIGLWEEVRSWGFFSGSLVLLALAGGFYTLCGFFYYFLVPIGSPDPIAGIVAHSVGEKVYNLSLVALVSAVCFVSAFSIIGLKRNRSREAQDIPSQAGAERDSKQAKS